MWRVRVLCRDVRGRSVAFHARGCSSWIISLLTLTLMSPPGSVGVTGLVVDSHEAPLQQYHIVDARFAIYKVLQARFFFVLQWS